MLTKEQLVTIMPRLNKVKDVIVEHYLECLNNEMEAGNINTKERIAMFLAQIAHESYELRYQREVWGPTIQQAKYERIQRLPWDNRQLAYRLGNSEKGDGYLFRGWGVLQTTGRSNTLKVSEVLFGDDLLIKNPELLNDFAIGLKAAVYYWTSHNLNEWADKKDIKRVTKLINGGYNGLEQREKYYNKALSILSC